MSRNKNRHISQAQSNLRMQQRDDARMQKGAAETRDDEQKLVLSGPCENWLAVPVAVKVGNVVTTFTSSGQIPWPGYAPSRGERQDIVIGVFNGVFQLAVPNKTVDEAEINDVKLAAPSRTVNDAEKQMVQRRLTQFAGWLPPKHIDKRCRDKHYIVSRNAAVAASLLHYNTLERMLIPGGTVTFEEGRIHCEYLVPAWLLFDAERLRELCKVV